MQTVLRQPDAAGYDVAAAVEYVQRLNGNVFVINAGGLYAFYPTKIEGHHVVQGLDGRDIIAEVSKAAQDAGIRVLLRVDFRGGHRDMFLRHPDWFSYDADGQPLVLNGFHAASPISPYRNEGYGFLIVRELLDRYDIDGIWENAPGFGPLAYGPVAADAFRNRTGFDLPVREDFDDPVYRSWLSWRYECVLSHTEALRDLIKTYGKDKAYVPEAPAMLDHDWLHRSGQDIAEQGNCWDIISAPTFDLLRGSYGSALHPVPVWRSEEVTKYLKAVRPDKSPAVLFGKFDNQSRYSSVVTQELKLWLAGILAHGGSFWDCAFVGTHGLDFHDQRNEDAVSSYYRLLRDNEEIFLGANPEADIAIVHSRVTEEQFGRNDPREDNYIGHTRGVEAALFDHHLPFDILPQRQISQEALSHYRVIVLPNVAILTEQDVNALRAYVSSGGGLVSTFETSLRDGDGRAAAEYALADVFGVRSLGVMQGPMQYAYSLIRTRNELTAGLEGTDICTNEGFIRYVAALPYAQVPLTLVPEIVPQPPEHGWQPTMKTDLPVVVAQAFGAGRSVFFPGQTDKLFASSGHPDHGLLLRNAIQWAAGDGEALVRTNAPAAVHISVTRQPETGRRMVHLINYAGGYRRPITSIQEIRDISVSLRNGGKITNVRLLTSGAELPFNASAGRVEFTIPSLAEYEAAVVECEPQ